MNIKLISPQMSLRPMDSVFKRVLSPSLSLVTIASQTPTEHYVWIEDENVEKSILNDDPDLVGITVNVDTSDRAFAIADLYRKKGIKVVFGGIHASSNPNLMLNHCDSVVIGEAEGYWSELLIDFSNGTLKKIYKNEFVPDLGNIPAPNWDYIKKNKYLYHNIISTSRGCPFKCIFCYNNSEYVTNPYRNRPLENVLEEINSLKTKQLFFIDDNFIGNIEWTKSFVKAIKGKGFTWHAAVSANIYHHKNLIDDFAESGCKSLFIGFESIIPESIEAAAKKQNKIEEYEALIELLHQKGIMVNASLVFGFDSDNKDVFKKTLDWLVKNKIETMTAHILTLYPGTVLYKELSENNRIIEKDNKSYNTSNVVFQPKQMTPEELKNGYLWIYKEFYSIKNILKRYPENKSIRKAYIIFNFGYRKYGYITSTIGRLGLMQVIGKLGRNIAYGIR